MGKKGGTACAVRGCASRNVDQHETFFRFPRDLVRSKTWLKLCNRLDLSNRTPHQLYSNVRICALHFEERMFSSPERNRLLPTALPTIFPDGREVIVEFKWPQGFQISSGTD